MYIFEFLMHNISSSIEKSDVPGSFTKDSMSNRNVLNSPRTTRYHPLMTTLESILRVKYKNVISYQYSFLAKSDRHKVVFDKHV